MRTLYVVQQINWAYDDQWHYEDGAIPRKAFVSRDAAEVYRLEKEQAARLGIVADTSPGYWSQNLEETFGSWDLLTTLDEDDLEGALSALGLPTPRDADDEDEEDGGWWRDFWESAFAQGKQDVVWQLFDKVRFYEVVEVEAEP